MAAWLLKPKLMIYSANRSGLSSAEISETGELELIVERQINRIRAARRSTLFGDPIVHLIQLMLATGWYCVSSMPRDNSWDFQVLNPLSVFPDYDSYGEPHRCLPGATRFRGGN